MKAFPAILLSLVALILLLLVGAAQAQPIQGIDVLPPAGAIGDADTMALCQASSANCGNADISYNRATALQWFDYVLGKLPRATNTTLGTMRGDGSTLRCVSGVCTVVGGGGGGGDTITSPNSTLTIGGTSTNTTLDLNLSHSNTWLAAQTIPGLTVTGSFTATGLVTNADLVNQSMTVNGTTCTLGSSCTPSGGGSGTVSSGTGPAIAQYNSGTGTTVGPATVSGDATMAQGGALTLANANATRINLGLNVNGALKVTTAGAASQAACADLSNGAASCSTDTTNAANISSGTLAAARMLPLTTGQVYVGNGSNVPASTPFATPAQTYLAGLPAGAPIKLVGVDGGNNIVTQTPFVTDVALTPGLTTAIGTCNTSLQHITATGQINPQTCEQSIIATGSITTAASGMLVKAQGAGITVHTPDPLVSNKGVTYLLTGDGTNSFTVDTASNTALFSGCVGGGGTSLTIAPNYYLWLDTDPDGNATPYYQCMIYGPGLYSLASNNTWTGDNTFVGAIIPPGPYSVTTSGNLDPATYKCGGTIHVNSGSTVTLTVLNSLPVNCNYVVEQLGAGTAVIAAGSGTTPHSPCSSSQTNAQYAILTVHTESNSDGFHAVYDVTGGCT